MNTKPKAIKRNFITAFSHIVQRGRYKFRILDHYKGIFFAKSHLLFIWLFRKNGRLFLALSSRSSGKPNFAKMEFVSNVPNSVENFESIIKTVYAHGRGSDVSSFRYFVKKNGRQKRVMWNHWFKPKAAKKQPTTKVLH